MKESLEQLLEAERAVKVAASALIVQATVRAAILRRKYLKIKRRIVICQKMCRVSCKLIIFL